jgi:predicted DsbA family dithiol-disulfide isomerase
MKVEIWSDIACPFCYIGKRKFENALTKFSDKKDVEVVWKSYQLDPSTQQNPGMSIHDYLAEKKGMSAAQAKEMNDYVTAMAGEVGLSYDFEKTVVANTFNAHRLIHLAAKHKLQDQAEESLFSAYFTRGKNIQDRETLIELGLEIGLDAQEVRQVLEGSAYADEVRKDFADALKVGVRGVPFFLFNNKYAISGAQPSDVFSQVLEKVRDEEIQVMEQSGGFCTPEGDCK